MNKMKKIIIVSATLAMLVCFLGIVNASLYNEIQQLQGRNCNLEDYGKVSFSETELINKFGLTGGGNCTFILDYLLYEPNTMDLVRFLDPLFGEIEHIITEDHEYLLLLGKNHSALEGIVNVAANYENYENRLIKAEEVIGFIEMPEPDEPPADDNCVDNSFENIYVGNNGSYGIGENFAYFNSSCFREDILLYHYCEGTEHHFFGWSCNCVEGKCVADVSEVFGWIDLFETYLGLGGRKVDSDFLYSAIKSWINS